MEPVTLLPSPRFMLSVIVCLSLIALPLVRAQHVHPAGVEGRARALVHSHQIQFPTRGGSQAYAAHGSHSLAIFLTTIYESVSGNSPLVPPHDHALSRSSPSIYPHLDVLGPEHAERLNRPAGPPPGGAPPDRSPPHS